MKVKTIGIAMAIGALVVAATSPGAGAPLRGYAAEEERRAFDFARGGA